MHKGFQTEHKHCVRESFLYLYRQLECLRIHGGREAGIAVFILVIRLAGPVNRKQEVAHCGVKGPEEVLELWLEDLLGNVQRKTKVLSKRLGGTEVSDGRIGMGLIGGD